MKTKSMATKKIPTLDKAFKQIFGAALTPMGFVKIKGKQPYYVRLVGDEIIHVITYTTRPGKREYKAFTVLGGVATVYRNRIDFEKTPRENLIWLHGNLTIQRKLKVLHDDGDLFSKLYHFYYKDETVIDAVIYALEMTEQLLLPALSSVIDLNTCVKYLLNVQAGISLSTCFKKNFDNNNPNYAHNEGLLYVKTRHRFDYAETMMSREAYTTDVERGCLERGKNYDEYTEMTRKGSIEAQARLDGLLNNPDEYEKVILELDRRKKYNTKILNELGIPVQTRQPE